MNSSTKNKAQLILHQKRYRAIPLHCSFELIWIIIFKLDDPITEQFQHNNLQECLANLLLYIYFIYSRINYMGCTGH